MQTYIALLRYTQQGMHNIKESPARLDAAKKAFKAQGAEVKAWYLVFGQYDAVIIVEAPDDMTYANFALMIGALGNMQLESLRAFTEAEYRQLIAGLP